jgi:tetratricopeptide (TPR) repeat protein
LNFLSRIKKDKMPVVLIILIAAINLYVLFLPLIGKLGYEHSALNSILVFIFSGLLSIKFYRNRFSLGENPFKVFAYNKYPFLLLIIIPFLSGFVSTIFFSTCPFSSGTLFYFIITIPAIMLAVGAGYFSVFISRKLSYLIFIVIILFFPFVSFVEFYFNPQIYFYNPLIGFTPGTIYDEDLSVELPLILYRLINISFAVGIMFFLPRFIEKKKILKTSAALSVIAAVFIFIILKPSLGFSTNEARLIKNLPRKITTEHFNIYLPDKSPAELSRIALLHEYYYNKIVIELKLGKTKKIDSFIFENASQKRKLFGSGNADVAKTWSHQIFLNYDTYEKSLKHELVHILSGYFGSTIFKISDGFNMAMVEGIAVAIENNFDGYPVHYGARLAFLNNDKIKITHLFSGLNFFTQYSSVSYIVVGSFVRFLIEKYGIEKIKKLYGDYDFKKVIGKDISGLEKDYKKFLYSIKTDLNENKAMLYFGGQPIFNKHCPRIAAAQIKKASGFYNERNYKEALKIFDDVYLYSGSFPSLSGTINSLIKLKKYDQAERMLEKEIVKFEKTRYYYTLEVLLSEALVMNNKIEEADKLFDKVIQQNPHIIYLNNILIKKEILKSGVDSLKKYITAETKEQYEMLFRLNSDSVCSFSVPVLLNFCKDSIQTKKVVEHVKDKLKTRDFMSAYALSELSEACEKIGDYVLAKSFAVKALDYRSDEHFSFMLSDNLKRINWLNDFSKKLKPFFVYQ